MSRKSFIHSLMFFWCCICFSFDYDPLLTDIICQILTNKLVYLDAMFCIVATNQDNLILSFEMLAYVEAGFKYTVIFFWVTFIWLTPIFFTSLHNLVVMPFSKIPTNLSLLYTLKTPFKNTNIKHNW